jgi:hypothetical protein
MDNYENVKVFLDSATKRTIELLESPEWKDIEEVDEGYCSHRKTEAGLFMTKATGLIQHPAQDICNLLWDYKRKKEYDDSVDLMYSVRDFNDSCRIMYQRVKAPWPVSFRDFVIATRFETIGDSIFLVGESCEAGVPEVEGVVRAQVISSCYKFKKLQPKSTEVTFLTSVDMKGNIPSMAMNVLSKRFCLAIGKIRRFMK